jgi:radical SAM superfamily enzyme YgiQ (UPF0313 family)
MAQGDILLLACYELGHQPLSLAWPASHLRQQGFSIETVDLAVQPFPQTATARARFVGIAVPMHTALRIGVRAAQEIRAVNPAAHICFFGLYAWLNADYLLDNVADSVIAGEVEEPLGRLIEYLAGQWASGNHETKVIPDDILGISIAGRRATPYLHRPALPIPERDGLPDLSHYARYLARGEYRLAGYVEASRGCLHSCQHCPVVPVYNGRFFIVPFETVMADIRNQVAAGARHITFGDPDFLNGPGHVMKITRALHTEFPDLTFDFTTKVEHILQFRHLLPELRALGASFVISAFEHVNNQILGRLKKGHSRADMDEALTILNDAGLPVQPTWLPFTPWTTLEDYVDLLAWIRARDLIVNVPAVQLSIRLLVPPNSALLTAPDAPEWQGELNPTNFTYDWRNPDPCVNEIQQRIAKLVERADSDPYHTFAQIETIAYGLAGRRPQPYPALRHIKPEPPRLTEDWFC